MGLNYVAPNMLAWFPSYGAMSEWYAVPADPRNPGRVLFADEMSGALWLSTEAGLDWRVVFRNPALLASTQTLKDSSPWLLRTRILR